MKLVVCINDQWAFVDLGSGYLLCIGRKEEVDGKTSAEVAQMIREALATSQYHDIHRGKGYTLH